MSPISNFYIFLLAHHLIVVSITISSSLNFLEFLGLNFSFAAALILTKSTIEFVYTTWLGRLMGQNIDLRALGTWAVVTGATDGVGLAYCAELAKQGMNIVLMSRSIDKLNNCALRLEKRFNIKTICIEMDFSGEVDSYGKILPQLQELEIGILINNVGMTYPRPTRFDEIFYKQNFVRDIINLNVLAVTMMTGAVLPGMVQRGKGAIINVGSMFSYFGGPYFTLYSSTKTYMQKFTLDLSKEFKDTGVKFQYQSPGYIATKMSRFKSSIAIPTAEQYASVGLTMIGLTNETSVWITHRLLRKLMSIVNNYLPEYFYDSMTTQSFKSFWLFAKKRELERLNQVVSSKCSEG